MKQFDEREKAYNDKTVEIIESLPNVVSGCKKFVLSKGTGNSQIEWADITYLVEFDMLVLIGVVRYAPGETVKLPNGETAVVTEDTTDYFKSMLRLGIPLKMAESGTDDDVLEFLKETIETEVVTVPAEENEASPAESFDLDELSEEQRKVLEMFKAQGYGKG